MIVIVANRWDESSQALARRWKDDDARVLTPRDLSRPGWRQHLGRLDRGRAVIDGEVVDQAHIAAVLTRLPGVFEQELEHVAPEDRVYVAAEMNAFLLFWLASLTCPVINRPSAGFLAGPAWRPEHWARLAVQAGCAVDAPACAVDQQEPTASVIVAGGRSFGDFDLTLQAQARRLAMLAGVQLLRVSFRGLQYSGVQLLPDLSATSVSDAVLETMQSMASALR